MPQVDTAAIEYRTSTPRQVIMRGRALALGRITRIMGVLNVTPDSFSDGGQYAGADAAVHAGVAMVRDGADLLDVGGESTRPGAAAVPVDIELRRVVPVIRALRSVIDVPISIDTTKYDVAVAALDAGADIINDISGLRSDPRLATLAAESGAALVLMHSRKRPVDMMDNPVYADVVADVRTELAAAVARAQHAGVPSTSLIIDPGIGFAKTAEHCLTLLRDLREMARLHLPLLVGPSRKSFIGAVLNLPVTDRLEGTAAAVALAIREGAHILRVHDVRAMVRVSRMVDAILQGGSRIPHGAPIRN